MPEVTTHVAALRAAAHASTSSDDLLTAAETFFDSLVGTTFLWLGDCRGPERTSVRTRAYDPLIEGLTGAVRGTAHPAWRAVADGSDLWVDSQEGIHLAHPGLGDVWIAETGAQQMWVVVLADRRFLIGFARDPGPANAEVRHLARATGRFAAIIDANPERSDQVRAMSGLTLRQRLVLNQSVSGKSTGQIADELNVSRSTVAHDLAIALAAIDAPDARAAAGVLATDIALDEVV